MGLFAGVKKLAPGHVLVWQGGEVKEHFEYWDAWGDPPERRSGSWEDDQEQLLALLRESVRARMIAEVPLGVMLSGGLDSSLITALMAEQSSGPVKTFSIGFAEEPGANELEDAQQVATRLGTEHHPLLTTAVEHPDLLDRALWHLEEPIADLSCLGFLLLSELASEHVTVALSGQGADELLGGYTKHGVAWLADGAQRLPRPLRDAAARLAHQAPDRSTLGRAAVAATTADPVERAMAMSRVMYPAERAELLTSRFHQPGAAGEIEAAVRDRLDPRAGSVLGQVLNLDRKLALVDLMFLYFDKMSMATSLEVRVPFMDHDVVSFCTALPDSRKVWRGRRKELLKRASQGLVDERILKKRKQAFFVGALGSWLRTHRDGLFRDVLLDSRSLERGYVRRDPLARLVAQGGDGDKQSARMLLSLLLLEKWHRMFVDPDGEAARISSEARAAGAGTPVAS